MAVNAGLTVNETIYKNNENDETALLLNVLKESFIINVCIRSIKYVYWYNYVGLSYRFQDKSLANIIGNYESYIFNEHNVYKKLTPSFSNTSLGFSESNFLL